MRRSLVAFFSVMASINLSMMGSRAVAQTTHPANPATNPAAQAVLDQVRDAYGKLKTLDLAGTVALDADAASQQTHHSSDFTARYQSPGKFRHEMKDEAKKPELTMVGTGEKLFTYFAPRNQYMTTDQPATRTADLGIGIGEMLHEQNPSLALALSNDACAELASGASAIETLADVQLDGKNYSALKLTQNDRDITMLVDPSSGLIRQMQFDMRKMFESQHVPQVKKVLLTIDYTTSKPDAEVDASEFAFAVPAGATLVDEKAASAGAGAEGDDPEQALVGKPAPAVKLANLDGKDVSPLVDNKGSVIVLDFWATWCPPCRASLPHLAELYKDKKDAGLKVFAIDLREDSEKVQQFLKQQKLDLPVLLDQNGNVAQSYFVNGIPQTVVINKDGTVRKVIVGFAEESAGELAKIVDEAMNSK